MHMKLRSIGAIATSVMLCIGAFANVANASPQPDDDQTKYEVCDVRLAPLPLTKAPSRAKPAASRVISRTCTEQPAKDGGPSLDPPVAGDVVIFVVYQHANFEGRWLRFFGTEPCGPSNAGFILPDTRPEDYGESWGTSSWSAHSQCWHTTIYYGYDLGGPSFTYNQGYWRADRIGAPFNDHVWSVYTRYR